MENKYISMDLFINGLNEFLSNYKDKKGVFLVAAFLRKITPDSRIPAVKTFDFKLVFIKNKPVHTISITYTGSCTAISQEESIIRTCISDIIRNTLEFIYSSMFKDILNAGD